MEMAQGSIYHPQWEKRWQNFSFIYGLIVLFYLFGDNMLVPWININIKRKQFLEKIFRYPATGMLINYL